MQQKIFLEKHHYLHRNPKYTKKSGYFNKKLSIKNMQSEKHPLKPFFPKSARLLMLGTFPPKRERWCMDFFYPNFQNDMWRIFGLIFFDNSEHFIIRENNKAFFDKASIEKFLESKKNRALRHRYERDSPKR